MSKLGRMKPWHLLLVIAAVAIGTTIVRGSSSRDGVVEEIADARPRRMFSARLSVPVRYRECRVVSPDTGSTIPRESCGPGDERLATLEALDTLGGSSNPDSLRASGLFALLDGDATKGALDTAIARLTRALPLSEQPESILVDLSAARLARAQHTQSLRDLLMALDNAREVLESEPNNPAALFNAALAMQTIGLDDEALRAWDHYLRTESTGDWADEARERRRLLLHTPPPRKPQPGASEAEVRAFATRYPQEARLYGWDEVLGWWGAAQEGEDTVRAAQLLLLAERLGAGVVMRGGDASLADAVAAIHTAGDDPVAMRALAQAHQTYAHAQLLHHDLLHEPAQSAFVTVVEARRYSPVLALSAEVFAASEFVLLGQFKTAESRFEVLIPQIDSIRYPALCARALWMQGGGRLRSGKYPEARQPLQASARLFERLGESEYASFAWGMDGEATFLQSPLVAYQRLHRALTTLREYRSSRWLANTLQVLAHSAKVDGMPRAASVIQEEHLSVALRTGEPHAPVEALLGRARMNGEAGRLESALRDLARADSLVKTIPAPNVREFLEPEALYSRALVTVDPKYLPALDSAVDRFSDRPFWLLLTLLQRANIQLQRRALAAAAADLDTVTQRVHELSEKLEGASQRIAVIEQARRHFDQLVLLHLAAGDSIEALKAVERGRVSFAGVTTTTPAAAKPIGPPGQIAVEYALIGSTLLIWTIRGEEVRLVRRRVNRGEFLHRVDKVVATMESRDRTASLRPDLAALYDDLVRPIKDQLGQSDTSLVIIADGEVAGVPFDALLDSASNRYLLEDHLLRFAPTLTDARRTAPSVDLAAHPPLLVDPAFDQSQYLSLNPLRGAQAEVDSIQALYPDTSIVLRDTSATPDSFERLAPRAGIIHYAGHALFDDARPEQSALILAGANTTGRLTAEAVNRLRLRSVRVVVLAACRTARAREGRSGGFAGFSGALLAAGAGGVVGSLWEVDDRTTRALMIEFHRAYIQTQHRDPARALRAAQLKLMQRRDPRRTSPATWAGFRYTGS